MFTRKAAIGHRSSLPGRLDRCNLSAVKQTESRELSDKLRVFLVADSVVPVRVGVSGYEIYFLCTGLGVGLVIFPQFCGGNKPSLSLSILLKSSLTLDSLSAPVTPTGCSTGG